MKTPTWGFASSPLVADDLVIVGVSGRLVAYDRVSGAPRWLARPVARATARRVY